MSELTPQPGDKVRLVKEGVVEDVNTEGECTVLLVGGYRYTLRDKRYAVEIVERADDPSRDPVGTIATVHNHLWIKHSINEWHNALMPNELRTNDGMRGRKVTGAVPGTPAAQAQAIRQPMTQAEARARLHPEPLVVQYGDPEPDTRRTYRSSNGITVEMGTFGWRIVKTNGDALINAPWSGIPAEAFPLTEVVGP